MLPGGALTLAPDVVGSVSDVTAGSGTVQILKLYAPVSYVPRLKNAPPSASIEYMPERGTRKAPMSVPNAGSHPGVRILPPGSRSVHTSPGSDETPWK